MSDFVKLSSGTYINLDHIYSIQTHSEERVTLWAGGVPSEVEGDDARAILAHIRGESTTSSHSGAARQAQELADSLSKGQGRRFDFVDSQGKPREATVSKEGDRWIAEVDGERYENGTEAGAMSNAMNGAA